MVSTPSVSPRRTNSDGLEFKSFGRSYEKVDGIDKVTGRSQFGADFTLPGSLHGMIVRSPQAATITRANS